VKSESEIDKASFGTMLYKYQLSHIDLCDVLRTELDDHCDKLQ